MAITPSTRDKRMERGNIDVALQSQRSILEKGFGNEVPVIALIRIYLSFAARLIAAKSLFSDIPRSQPRPTDTSRRDAANVPSTQQAP